MAGHGLHLTDLDDYLLPSQECILPEIVEVSDKKIDIVVEDGISYEVGADGTKTKLESASISLADCLACSGCVTSAESMLVSQQSKEEFLKQVQDHNRVLIISISPHARASLAVWAGLHPNQVQSKLRTFFMGLGARLVLDIAFAHDIEIHERCLEFIERYRATDATPMIESSCPGWICYAEKTQGFVLPLISRAKSAQQIMGTIVKDHYAKSAGLSREQIYHCSIAPCHDKKLEASRHDFHDGNDIRDVDVVLTASELRDMLMDSGVDLQSLPETPSEESELFPAPEHEFSSSWGGCMERVLQHAAAVLFPDTACSIVKKEGKNKDTYEYHLLVNDKLELRFAAQYGFRNLQNLVRKLKSKSKIHMIEAMACPGACLNGGGQVPPVPPMRARDLLGHVQSAYKSQDVSMSEEALKEHVLSPQCQQVYDALGPAAFRTQYHAIEKIDKVNPVFIRW